MDYELLRSRRKTLAIHLLDSQRVQVRAPLHLSGRVIEDFVRQKAPWIAQKQAQLRNQEEALAQMHRQETGLYALGNLCPVVQTPGRSAFDGQTWFLTRTADPAALEREITTLYRQQTRLLTARLVEQWAPRVHAFPLGITITSAQTRWGSCSGKGRLAFPHRLFAQPLAAVEYVVVHELCHLLEHNHSPAFWALVEQCLPDYRQRRALLTTRYDRIQAERERLTRQRSPS